MQKPTETPTPTLKAVEERISAKAWGQARAEIVELENYLSEWSRIHKEQDGRSRGFWAAPFNSYDKKFTVPSELYNTDNKKGWNGFRENYITARAKELAEQMAAELLKKFEVFP
jgi:hypothetical protein